MEKAFERLCEAFENHLEKTGRYHDTLIERVTLDLKGIRPAFLPADAVRDIRELKGFRHLFRHQSQHQSQFQNLNYLILFYLRLSFYLHLKLCI